VSRWFLANLNQSDDSAAVKRWGKLLGRFDEDGDGGFDDDELLRLFDSIDELPGATDDIKELGGDAGETQRLLFLGMALVLAVLVAAAVRDVFVLTGSIESLSTDLRRSQREENDRKAELAALSTEGKQLKERCLRLAAAAARSSEGAAELAKAKAELEANERKGHQVEAERRAASEKNRQLEADLNAAQWGLEARRKGAELISKFVFDAGGRKKPKRLQGAAEGSVTTKQLITSADGDVWLDMQDRIATSGPLGGFSMHDLWKVTNIATGEHRVMKRYKKVDHAQQMRDSPKTKFLKAKVDRLRAELDHKKVDHSQRARDSRVDFLKAEVDRLRAELDHVQSQLEDALAAAAASSTAAAGGEADEKFDHHENLISELCAACDLTPHPSIMRFDKVIETDDAAFVLCEFLDGIDLFTFTFEHFKQGVDEATAKHLFRQIFSAFAHLHDRCGVLHNDVKSENLFVVGVGGTTAQLQAKIIDFGLASFPGKKPKVADRGTNGLSYCAPELLNQAQDDLLPVLPNATKEMDLFRLGVVLYMLLMKNFPNPPITPPEPSQPARRFKDLPKWRALSPACKELIGRLLAYDPKARPTAQAALQHAWFHT
jgi:serine/threonine protein kinase